MELEEMIDPKRQHFVDQWLRCLPTVTQAMKESGQRYIDQKTDRDAFLNVCDDELQRLKELEEQQS